MPSIHARPTSQESRGEWPLTWVVVALMALIAGLCWGLAAAGYAHHELGYTLRHSLWLVILFIVLEALALVFWWWAGALEKELVEEERKRRA